MIFPEPNFKTNQDIYVSASVKKTKKQKTTEKETKKKRGQNDKISCKRVHMIRYIYIYMHQMILRAYRCTKQTCNCWTWHDGLGGLHRKIARAPFDTYGERQRERERQTANKPITPRPQARHCLFSNPPNGIP